jgi:hypothetical protein
VKLKNTGVIFAISVGLFMIGWWTFALLSGGMPEIQTKPIDSIFHLVVEYLTGALLVLGGYGLVTQRSWGIKVYFISLGMLLYAEIQASGYYAQHGVWEAIGVFSVLILATLTVIALSMKKDIIQLRSE